MTHIVLTIAGFDPSGGAGLQADLKTFQVHGVYGLSVATAITVQNTQGVSAVYPLAAAQVKEQLLSLLADFKINTVKIGVLGSAENIRAVVDFLKLAKIKQVILDPLIRSKSGFPLLDEAALKILQEELIPQVQLITPNSEEAAQLCRFPITDKESMQQAAVMLRKMGAECVLIKGALLSENEVFDLFFDGQNYAFRQWPIIKAPSPHGTGCILSAAIAANLASNQPISQAVLNAQEYLRSLRQNPLKIGKGYPLLP